MNWNELKRITKIFVLYMQNGARPGAMKTHGIFKQMKNDYIYLPFIQKRPIEIIPSPVCSTLTMVERNNLSLKPLKERERERASVVLIRVMRWTLNSILYCSGEWWFGIHFTFWENSWIWFSRYLYTFLYLSLRRFVKWLWLAFYTMLISYNLSLVYTQNLYTKYSQFNV